MSKAENLQGPRLTREGNFEVCSLCPLLGDTGYILAKGNPCKEEAYRNCSQLLGENTTPKKIESGNAHHLSGEMSAWRRKRYIKRG